MSTATRETIDQQTFDGLAFPVVRVKYAGPTDSRGSRWIATMRRDNERTYRCVVSYDAGAPEGARNAIRAAQECWKKACADLGSWNHQHVAIPGDLDADTYAFTMVPLYLLNGEQGAGGLVS